MSDAQLEAARKQRIHNLKLKTACLENEEDIMDLLASSQRADLLKQKIDAALAKAGELLTAVDVATKWSLTEAYDLQKLMRVCGLEVSPRELYKPEDEARVQGIAQIKSTLEELKQHRNVARIVDFTQSLENAAGKIDDIEAELVRSQLDATELCDVAAAVLKPLGAIMEVTCVNTALMGNENQVESMMQEIPAVVRRREEALAAGDVAAAHEFSVQLEVRLLERLVELVQDKFRIIGQTDDENRMFAKIHDVQKKAFQETAAMKDSKRRLKQRCEEDLKHLHDAIQKADLEDAEAMKRDSSSRERSNEYFRDVIAKMDAAWVAGDGDRVQKLGRERFEEVKRRIDDIDKEEKRRVEYQQFLEVASQHKKLLELTISNCEVAVRCLNLVEELAWLCCSSAVKSRYEVIEYDLAQRRLGVHKDLHEAVRRLHAARKKLLHQAEEQFLEDEAEAHRRAIASVVDAWQPTKEALTAAGVEFVALGAE